MKPSLYAGAGYCVCMANENAYRNWNLYGFCCLSSALASFCVFWKNRASLSSIYVGIEVTLRNSLASRNLLQTNISAVYIHIPKDFFQRPRMRNNPSAESARETIGEKQLCKIHKVYQLNKVRGLVRTKAHFRLVSPSGENAPSTHALLRVLNTGNTWEVEASSLSP